MRGGGGKIGRTQRALGNCARLSSARLPGECCEGQPTLPTASRRNPMETLVARESSLAPRDRHRASAAPRRSGCTSEERRGSPARVPLSRARAGAHARGPARAAACILLLSACAVGANSGAVTDEPAHVFQHGPSNNAVCAPAAARSAATARKPLRAGWPEPQADSTYVPKYNMKYDMEDYAQHPTPAIADGSEYCVSKWHTSDAQGMADAEASEGEEADLHSAVSSESCDAVAAPHHAGGGGAGGAAGTSRARKRVRKPRVVRVQRGESVGSEVSRPEDGESAAPTRVSRSGSPVCLKQDRSATLRLGPVSPACDGLPRAPAHRSRTRLLERLEQGDPCGWCCKPLNGSWLMGYDTLHCSEACLRATERSLDGARRDFDVSAAFLREVVCPDSGHGNSS